MLAEASSPSDPTTPPISSDRMSPNMFSVRITSNSAGLSQLKCDARDALNLRLTVAHGVERVARAGRAFDGTRLAEIQSAKQFAHNKNVGSLDDFFAKRRAGRQ